MVLWFGTDMFCQMNLLTRLAYLDEKGDQGRVFFHAMQERTYEVKEESEIRPEGYTDIYREVLIRHRMPKVRRIPAPSCSPCESLTFFQYRQLL